MVYLYVCFVPRSANVDGVSAQDQDDAEAQRQYIRSKTRRFVKVATSMIKRRGLILITWVCAPLDHALQRVQHLSAQRGSVLQLLHLGTSPIVECQSALKSMMVSDLQDGPLDTVFGFGFTDAVMNLRTQRVL